MIDSNATSPKSAIPRLVITPGEPAGIGPDVVLMAAQQQWDAELVCIADSDVLTARAQALGLAIELLPYTSGQAAEVSPPGTLKMIHVPVKAPVTPGALDTANAGYVLATLNLGAELCRAGEAQALVTAPVQKSVINDAGIPFSGHTEFFQALTDTPTVVMLLAARELRVALATTHLPLTQVPAAINQAGLESTLRVLAQGLQQQLGISNPRITVLGLNPHAGEGGHLGREEIEIIAPAIATWQAEGLALEGPLPADTAFNPDIRARTDAYLAMYHDQGLPVLKALGFGGAVNVTLGLPFLRVSVDHGTALDLAGTGKASAASLETAMRLAVSSFRAK